MDIIHAVHSVINDDISSMIMFTLILIVIDFITGIVNSLFKKEFKSSAMRQGLMNKSREVLTIMLGILFDALGTTFMPCKILPTLLVYLIFMEASSIIENCDLLLPDSVKMIFKKGDKKNDNGSES